MSCTDGRISVLQRHLQPCNTIQLHNTSARIFETTEIGNSSQFKYTLDNPLLTSQQRRFYEENGYLIISNLIEESLIDEFSTRFVDICEGRVDKGALTMMKDISLWKQGAKGQYLYYKIQNLNYDDVFMKYIVHDKILDYVECFVGPDIMAIHPMLINKPPDSGKLTTRHPMHQDMHAFPFGPADRIVAAWTAMERINEDNGCLFVIPGSHRSGTLYNHDYPKWKDGVNLLHYTIEGFDDAPKKMLVMEKGDTVFFHPLLMHGSGTNITKGFRKSISCHYASSRCQYFDVRGTPIEKIGNEITQLMLKLGVEGSYTEFWKYRSILARGERINM